MNIFLPEMIYDELNKNEEFLKIYNNLNSNIDAYTNCFVEYSNIINDETIYEEFDKFLEKKLSEKHKKIWNCFSVCVDFDQKNDEKQWATSRKIIDDCKNDLDLDVKMYAYYMELANTADHESEIWIKNVEESLVLWKENEHKIFDPRLYTKYYWDIHEKNSFYLKEKKNKNFTLELNNFLELDAEVKKFIYSKHNTKYFRDIIEHKTIYSCLLFWYSLNDESLIDPKESIKILYALDTKIADLNFKYNDFNMHLMEWMYANFKWWFDLGEINNSVQILNMLVDTVDMSVINRKKSIKALNHHNFNYISNYLIFVRNLFKIENLISLIDTSYVPRIHGFNWTEKEKKVILNDDNNITNGWWKERYQTLNNYEKNMLETIKNRILG
ncbi:MAG: hypothetical protein ACO295_00345 [Sediminibacterium sp.]